MFDLLSGRVDASNILAMININVPPFSFRNHRFLSPNFHRTNYGLFEPLNNMMLMFNIIVDDFDCITPRDSFRRVIIEQGKKGI